MRAVVQRVAWARVEVEGRIVGEIGKGLLVLLGVSQGDGERQAAWMSNKLHGLRVFPDSEGKMNVSATEAGADILVVSNFTVCGDVSRGMRPSFVAASAFEEGRAWYERVLELLRAGPLRVEAGEYGGDMAVSLENDGPVTLVIDSPTP